MDEEEIGKLVNAYMFHRVNYSDEKPVRRRKRRQVVDPPPPPPVEVVVTTHFDDVTGSVLSVGDVEFGPHPIQSQSSTSLPGHATLRAYVSRTSVGVFPVLDVNYFSRASTFSNLSFVITSGNYDNLKIDITGYDINDNVIGIQTEIINASTVSVVDLNFPNLVKVEMKRNPTSTEVRHALAVGTVISIGGRPRTVFDKGVAISDIKYTIIV